ncbi:unnamed protein product [Rotaria sp. Silwood2]|nr:unnamed protein product [Rotaria sp. Silwood2]CAF2500781.1 unnamed protein product [Rotaria sp. Silwood2]CAF2898565.1 unnamed protein product [Rotaria sp. Silwood2]CAF4197859.1 unnamed protein product [Rotaria sp. Silwood2]CAF4376726.1 unnamed protein product [Rotaria sp. Silwood2]
MQIHSRSCSSKEKEQDLSIQQQKSNRYYTRKSTENNTQKVSKRWKDAITTSYTEFVVQDGRAFQLSQGSGFIGLAQQLFDCGRLMSSSTNIVIQDLLPDPTTMRPSSDDREIQVPSLSTRMAKHPPTMGLLDAINLLLTCTIGSGIFISAKTVLEYSGSYGLSIVVWIGCGLLCIMGALCYAELGCSYVSSGGDYIYLRAAFGNLMGFLRVWIDLALLRPMLVVLSILTASNYLVYWFYPTCTRPGILVKCLSSFLLLIVGFINLISAVATKRLHQVCNYCKIVFIIVAGIYRMYLGRVENFSEPFEGSTYGKITRALYAGLFPYGGWHCLNNAIDDLKDPNRILPRSIVISLLICILIYFLTFSSYFTALSAYDILMSDATAVSFAERILPFLLYIVPIGVTMSCVGTASGNLFIIGQMFKVAGRDGLMPHVFSMKHYESNVPMIAILFAILLSFSFLFFMSNIGKLIICVGMLNWACILLTVVGLIVLRYKHPNRERPIKVHLIVPIVFISILVILIVASALNDIENISTSLFLLTTAIPVYMFRVMWKKKPSNFNRRYNLFAIMLQKLFHLIRDEHNE